MSVSLAPKALARPRSAIPRVMPADWITAASTALLSTLWGS